MITINKLIINNLVYQLVIYSEIIIAGRDFNGCVLLIVMDQTPMVMSLTSWLENNELTCCIFINIDRSD